MAAGRVPQPQPPPTTRDAHEQERLATLAEQERLLNEAAARRKQLAAVKPPTAVETEQQRRLREEEAEFARIRERAERERLDAELARKLANAPAPSHAASDAVLARQLMEQESAQRSGAQAAQRAAGEDAELARIMQEAEEAKALEFLPDHDVPPDVPPEPEPDPVAPSPQSLLTETLRPGELLADFLARAVPSQLHASGNNVKLVVRNPMLGGVTLGWDETRFRALKVQWEQWHNPRSPDLPSSTDMLFKMCVARKLTTGRWVLRTTQAKLDDVWAKATRAVFGGRLGLEASVVLGDLAPSVPVYIRTRDFRDGADVYKVFCAAAGMGAKGRLVYVADVVHLLDVRAENRLGPGRRDISVNFYAQSKAHADDCEDRAGLSLKRRFEGGGKEAAARATAAAAAAAATTGKSVFDMLGDNDDDDDDAAAAAAAANEE